LAALQQLGGNAAPQQAQNILQQYAGQSGQAGQFAANPAVQGNATGFQNANTAQINAYNQALAPTQTALGNAQTASNNINTAINGATGFQKAFLQGVQQQDTQALNNAQNAYNAALASENAGTGGLQTFNITPQQAALQQIQQGNS
jgi:hypothetical protein